MKRFFLLVAVFTMSVSVAFSQASFGLKGGLNLATLTQNEGDAKMKPSIYVGGFMEYRFGTLMAISPELYYSRQGFHADEEGVKMNFRTNYLNLPVLAKIYVADGLSIDLGPQVGFMLNSKLWAKSGGQTVTLDIPNEFVDVEMNSVDVSFAMGLTYNIGNIFVQGRYNLGLTDVVKDDSIPSKNSVLQLGMGVRF